MYKNRRISVVIPAFNEAMLIEYVLKALPDYIDKVYVVDDGSQDKTYELVKSNSLIDPRIVPIQHEVNKGVGAAIVTGYKQSLEEDIDISVVMAGDNQMDPSYVSFLIDPIIAHEADYTKGNRLSRREYLRGMSPWRRFGNFTLTLLTKVSSGYWRLSDPQNGFTAISQFALKSINLDAVYPRYGYCNDLLAKMNVCNIRVRDVPMPARYGDEKSKIVYSNYIVKVSWILLNNLAYRLKMKYVVLPIRRMDTLLFRARVKLFSLF